MLLKLHVEMEVMTNDPKSLIEEMKTTFDELVCGGYEHGDVFKVYSITEHEDMKGEE